MALCPRNLTQFQTSAESNDFLVLSDYQIIVTTCKNAAQEKEKLLDLYDYSVVLGLPSENQCAGLEG